VSFAADRPGVGQTGQMADSDLGEALAAAGGPHGGELREALDAGRGHTKPPQAEPPLIELFTERSRPVIWRVRIAKWLDGRNPAWVVVTAIATLVLVVLGIAAFL